MTYKVLIVDDEPEARLLLTNYIHYLPDCELVAECKNATSALKIISEEQIDLAFLDINMPGLSGVELAKALPKSVKVIFTTAHREYALEGFELMAVDYLLKPISLDRFLRGAYKFISEAQPNKVQIQEPHSEQLPEFIFVRSNRKMIKVVLEDIKYIESLNDYLKLHMLDEILIVRETLSNMSAQLGEHHFLRCHRSYIVSFRHITSYTNEHINVDKKMIPISRGYKDVTLTRLNSY